VGYLKNIIIEEQELLERTNSNALDRFKSYLYSFTQGSSKDKTGNHVQSRITKESAIKWFSHIQINQITHYYIAIDLDNEDAYSNVQSLVLGKKLPQPTILIKNKDNGKCHLFYELERGVVNINHKNYVPNPETHQSKIRQYQFYKIVRTGLNKYLEGDNAFISNLVKNPFREDLYDVEVNNVVLPLGKLKEFGQYAPVLFLKPKSRTGSRSLEDMCGEGGEKRNCELFNTTRFYAYNSVASHEDKEAFSQDIIDYTNELNSRFSKPLGIREVRDTVKSIVNYCWRNKHYFKVKSNQFSDLQRHRSLLASAVKRTKTELQIEEAIKLILSNNKKITYSSIATHVGISRQAISRHYRVFVDNYINSMVS
jgi:hypothetical protein